MGRNLRWQSSQKGGHFQEPLPYLEWNLGRIAADYFCGKGETKRRKCEFHNVAAVQLNNQEDVNGSGNKKIDNPSMVEPQLLKV